MPNELKFTTDSVSFGAGTPADNYRNAAQSFFTGVTALPKGRADLAIACALLASQCLECALKSYLSKVGESEKYLKAAVRRHNLEALWIDAVAKGLAVASQPPD